MSVVSVSMPEELLNRIDQFADDHGYTGRSEVLREASRNLLGEFEDKKLEDRDLMGVVTVVFDYETTPIKSRSSSFSSSNSPRRFRLASRSTSLRPV